MSWQCIEIVIEVQDEKKFSDLLLDHEALSVTTVSADETEIFETNGQVHDNWQSVKLTGLFNQSTNLKPILTELALNPEAQVTVKTLANQNWECIWLDNFVPIKINQNLWVVPSWHEAPDLSAINVQIDPGMSFGTGTHESTRLCLAWLADMELQNKTLLDYGCGSGILAIAGLMMGACQALATDIEPRSLATTVENAQNNKVADKMNVYLPEKVPQKKVDIVIANILATTIIELKSILINHVCTKGQLLLAGILLKQETMIKQTMPEFQWQSRYQGNWVALLGQK